MKTSEFGTYVFAAFMLCAFGIPGRSPAQTGQLTADPPAIPFGPHDLGTATPISLAVKNNAVGAVNFGITLSGTDPSEFSWNSTCLSNLPSGSKCDVTVFFSPLKITKAESREAQLVISSDKGESQTVKLTGSAFQNLGVSPPRLRFADQLVDKPASPLAAVVTNYSDATLSGITILLAGDFTERHTKCEKLAPGASCAISVVFSPKASGATTGSLTVTADQSGLGKAPTPYG